MNSVLEHPIYPKSIVMVFDMTINMFQILFKLRALDIIERA